MQRPDATKRNMKKLKKYQKIKRAAGKYISTTFLIHKSRGFLKMWQVAPGLLHLNLLITTGKKTKSYIFTSQKMSYILKQRPNLVYLPSP